MPDNRLIDAHLLHPRASMTIPWPSNVFIEEAYGQELEKPCCDGQFRSVAPSAGTAGGHRKPISNHPAHSSHRCLRAMIDSISRASSREVTPRKVPVTGMLRSGSCARRHQPRRRDESVSEDKQIHSSLALLSFHSEKMFLIEQFLEVDHGSWPTDERGNSTALIRLITHLATAPVLPRFRASHPENIITAECCVSPMLTRHYTVSDLHRPPSKSRHQSIDAIVTRDARDVRLKSHAFASRSDKRVFFIIAFEAGAGLG